VTRKRVAGHAGAAWAAAVAGAWLVAASCRSLEVSPGTLPGAGATAVAAENAPPVAAPSIRVGIRVDVEGAVVAADAGVIVRVRVAGETAWLVRRLPVATFEPGGAEGGVRLVETGDEAVSATASPALPGELLRADGVAYRGLVEVRPGGAGRLTVVNVVHLEDYLRGVVPNELSPGAFPEVEALKAQAVAARSFALAHRGSYGARGFDVCATPACQLYRGASSEHPLTDRAVEQTRGVVATWRGRPIKAYYTSTCGGHTEEGSAIFADGAPYLRGVACPVERAAGPGGRAVGAPAEAGSPAARGGDWEVRLTPAGVARSIGRYGAVGEVLDLVPRRIGVSGRVVELAVLGSEGELVLRGLQVRWGLGLRENLFVVKRETGRGGELERFVVTGRGWGHGVGLCQVGAHGMAREGRSFEQILLHYYSGVRIVHPVDHVAAGGVADSPRASVARVARPAL
jgi:peptidoglycan hydrolase-like amidase